MKSNYKRLVSRVLIQSMFLVFISASTVYSQGSMNVVLRGNWDNNLLPIVMGFQYNDVWGYAAGGREYGIIGSTQSVHIIDVTNPTVPTQVAVLNNACGSTVWRDFATYQHYLYTISDNCAGSSLQIYDLNPLPAAPTLVYNSTAFFGNAHTLEINEVSGRIYVGGASTQMNGVIILDILGHPTTPTQIATFTLGSYVHDTYVHNDTLYAFFGSNGVASFDLKNIAAPYALGSLFGYPEAGYAHSGTGVKNNKNLIWADETANKGLHVANISDPYNPTFQAVFRSALLAPTYTNSEPHNIVAVGDYIYVGYYQDGLQIWNIANPTAPVRVGYYDTNVNATYTGQVGAWGVHPPLPSGNILISDTQNGLFVLQFNNVFPANMVNFAVDAMQDHVHLRWTTESETSCKGFMVERSVDGENFDAITEVAGAGTSTTRLDYQVDDRAPLNGRSYYRLRQMDFDGNTSYSEIQVVDFGKAIAMVSAFPNPSQPGQNITLRFEGTDVMDATLEILDMVGRRVYEKQLSLVPGPMEIELPSAQWVVGSYLLRLEAGMHTTEQKIVVTK